MLTPIKTDRSGILAFDVTGKLTDADYKTLLMPALERHLKDVKQGHLLFRFGPDFEGYTAHAMLDDSLLAARHLHDFERIAVVSDHAWLNIGLKLFGPLMPAHIKLFSLDEMDQAKTWVVW